MANEPSDGETFGEVEDRIDDRLAVFRVMEQELDRSSGAKVSHISKRSKEPA